LHRHRLPLGGGFNRVTSRRECIPGQYRLRRRIEAQAKKELIYWYFNFRVYEIRY
jgi:hypothetical protein